MLSQMGIQNAKDLLLWLPRGWEDRRLRFTVRDMPMGEKVALRVEVSDIEFTLSRNQLGIATASVRDSAGVMSAVWFRKSNPRYDVFAGLRELIKPGRHLYLWGQLEFGPRGRQFRVEDAAPTDKNGELADEDRPHFQRIVPLYPVPEGLSEKLLRSLVFQVLGNRSVQWTDVIPATLLEKLGLRGKPWSVQTFHFPESLMAAEQARQHLSFEEFLVLETALMMLHKKLRKNKKTHRFSLLRNLLTPFRQGLGFEFTAAQKRVIREIFDDLLSPYPMYRLLQGDVGSGKTIVALSAMLLAAENGGQAVLMVPTEILAEQHSLTFERFLRGLDIRWALLTGRQTAAEKKRIISEIQTGRISLLIGTHALLQKNVHFKNLLLAVVDEQHRFGVEHRSLLRAKGDRPDILVMTATPIPRTLAMTLYGDLDVSVLDGLPPGRIPTTTTHVPEAEAYAHIRRTAAAGQQAYLVYPLVRESDKLELKAVVEEASALQNGVLRDLHVGILHGQMPPRDKESVMQNFREGKLDVLIATSIIEVGIDVPNATLMVIQHAERFGLATLHQLRGRVGRGQMPSSCLLIAETRSEEARRRIEAMVHTTDGFRLSEEDLSMRGPGEVLGTMQHGMPLFRAGHLIRDARLIQQARHEAATLVQDDPELRRPDHAALRQAVVAEYGSRWDLATAG